MAEGTLVTLRYLPASRAGPCAGWGEEEGWGFSSLLAWAWVQLRCVPEQASGGCPEVCHPIGMAAGEEDVGNGIRVQLSHPPLIFMVHSTGDDGCVSLEAPHQRFLETDGDRLLLRLPGTDGPQS